MSGSKKQATTVVKHLISERERGPIPNVYFVRDGAKAYLRGGQPRRDMGRAQKYKGKKINKPPFYTYKKTGKDRAKRGVHRMCKSEKEGEKESKKTC